jgi:heterodisulfide reductase subunit C/nitrate reductase gamma subunit
VLISNVATIALGVCLTGLLWRISRWFLNDLGPATDDLSTGRRLAATSRAFQDAVLSAQLFRLIGVFLWEVLLQGHLLRQDRLRWAMHMTLCYGFLLLVLLHALDDWTAPMLFADYYPTRNPFRWLRNLLAALVLFGVLGTMIRLRTRTSMERFRSHADRLVLLLLAVIIVSGILLESSQILSPAIFEEMVADYMGDDDPDEVAALRHYWTAEMGAALPPFRSGERIYDAAAGQEAHEAYCASCHSRPQSAFLSYPVSRLLKPGAELMGTLRFDIWLWTIHYLASCLALACLPFSKFFHLLATPLNLLARTAGPVSTRPPALRPTRRALGLDACTHCGICTEHCSVAPIYRVIPNTTILPSEKIQGVKRQVGRGAKRAEMAVLAEGSFICTLCGRCTQWCPSGIDLQDLWQASRQALVDKGFLPFYDRTAIRSGAAIPAPRSTDAGAPPASLGLTDRPETFWGCVQCTTCTSVCPVVAASDDPQRDLDLTPQQIMNLMRLQLKEQALSCRMLWDCVTCYQCQEHCPQNVKVADVLYELRNEAGRRGIATAQATAT